MADGAGRHDWGAVSECLLVVFMVEKGVCEDPRVCDDLSEDNDRNGRVFDSFNGLVIVLPTEGRGTVLVCERGHSWVDQGD